MNYIKNMLKSKFGKSVLMIVGGTASAQILSTLLYPIITRIYSPDEYGLLTIFTALVGILSIGSSFKYEYAIPIADDDDDALNIIALCLVLLAIYVSVFILIFVLFGETILKLINGQVLNEYIAFLILATFFTGLYEIFMQWGFRKKNFKSISRTILSRSFSQNISILGLGLMGLGSMGLLLSNILGRGVGIIPLAKPVVSKASFSKVTKKSILNKLKRYVGFPIFTMPSHLLGSIGNKLPIMFITSLYGIQAVGLYGLSYAIVNLPSILIGKAIGDVFYGEVAAEGKKNPQKIKNLSNSLLKKLILVGLMPLIILLIWGPLLFSLIFGEEWYEAGIYARIISVFIFVRLIFSPISRVFEVFERQKIKLFLDIVRIIFILATFGISKVFDLNSYYAIGLYGISMSFVHLLTYLVSQSILKSEIEKQ